MLQFYKTQLQFYKKQENRPISLMKRAILLFQIIDKYKAENNNEMLVCPACGLDVHSDFKTCPRCGAYMKGGNERLIDADELLKRIHERQKSRH